MSKGVQTGEVLELNKLRSHALSDSELGLRMTHLDMAKYCSACSVLVLPRKLVRRRFVALSQFLFATAGLPDKTGCKVSIETKDSIDSLQHILELMCLYLYSHAIITSSDSSLRNNSGLILLTRCVWCCCSSTHGNGSNFDCCFRSC